MKRPSAQAQRSAFTLMEMLVVVAIIAILVAIAAGAYVRVMNAQQESRSQDAVRIFAKSLLDNWNKVKSDAEKEDINAYPALLSLANGDPARAYVLLKIFRITEAFPQNYAEIQFPFSTTATIQNATIYGTSAQPAVSGQQWIPTAKRANLATYNNKLASAANLSANVPTTQSAACLFLSLTLINRGGSLRLSEDQMQVNIKDTDQDGVSELIDNYNKSLVFIRFPIGAGANNGFSTFAAPYTIPPLVAAEVAALPNGTKAGHGDPLDPDGLLQQHVLDPATNKQLAWWKAAYVTTPKVITNGQLLTSLCGHPFPGAPAAPQPYYVPFITSKGADGIYGANPPGTEASDDIVSYRLK